MQSPLRIGFSALLILSVLVVSGASAQSAKVASSKAQIRNEPNRPDPIEPDGVSINRVERPGSPLHDERPKLQAAGPVRGTVEIGPRWNSLGTTIADVRPLPVQDPTRYYGSPALLSLENGEVALAYTEYGTWEEWRPREPIDKPKLWFTRTTDGGETWQEPVLVAEGEHGANFMYLTMVRTATGRLLINDEAYFRANHLVYSDDDGASWTSTEIVEYAGTIDRLYGPIGGEVWHPYRDLNDDALKYIASADGVTWSEPRTMMENPHADSVRLAVVGIVETAPGELVALLYRLMFDPCCDRNAAVVRSTDGGNTWSDPQIIDTGNLQPRMFGRLRLSQGGALGYVFQDAYCLWCQWDENYFQVNIYYMSSDDLGVTWSSPIRFTRYIGTDFHPDLAFAGETPLIVFGTTRYTPIHPLGLLAYSHLWYGVPGVSQEGPNALPPRTDFASYGVTPAGPDVPLRLTAVDEAGLAAVVLRVSPETGEPVEKALFDDGEHGDKKAVDGVWGNTFELAFPSGYELTVSATDVDGVSSENSVSITTTPTHHSGRLFLGIRGNNRLGIDQWVGYPMANLNWPTWHNLGNLFAGEFTLGTDRAPGGQTVVDPPWTEDVRGLSINSLGEDITVFYRDTTSLKGLVVEQRTHSYDRSSPDSTDFIVFQYLIHNLGSNDLENLVGGLRLDLDIPLGPPSNAGIPLTSEPNTAPWGAYDDQLCYDEQHEIIYQFDSGRACTDWEYECPTIFVGVTALSDSVLTAARWTESFDDPADEFAFMTSGIDPNLACDVQPEPNDYRLLLTGHPFNLPAGDSNAVAFGIVVGDGYDDMLNNASIMRAAYDTLSKTLTITGVDDKSEGSVPHKFALHQNYPNPFNPTTAIVFELPSREKATLKIFDILGRETATLFEGMLGPGRHRYAWTATNHASGVYFYRLEAGSLSAMRKLVLLR